MFLVDQDAEIGAEWISACVAEKLSLAAFDGSVDAARQFIIRRCGADRIRTWCAVMQMEVRGGSQAGSRSKEKCLVSPEFWSFFENPPARKGCDWRSGDFTLQRTDRLGKTNITRLIGTLFSKYDLMRELPDSIEVDDKAWMPAKDALEFLIPPLGHYDAPRTIAKRAYAGLITAKARRFCRGARVADDVELPREFWWASGEAALEQNWSAGDFSTWIDQRDHWQAFGVTFRREDIAAIVPHTIDSHISSQEFGNDGWVRAPDVLEVLRGLNLSEDKAREIIHLRAASGLVQVRAERLVQTSTEGREESRKALVDPSFWGDPGIDLSTVWTTGDVALQHVSDPENRVYFHGIEFRRADIESIGQGKRKSHTALEKPDSIGTDVHLSPYLKIMIEAARRANIRPGAEGQSTVEALKALIDEVNKEFGIALSENDRSRMASFIREPESRVGVKKLAAEARRGSPIKHR